MSEEIPDVLSTPDQSEQPLNSAWKHSKNNALDSYQSKKLSVLAKSRIKRDIMQLLTDPITGVIIYPDEHDLTLVYALITGLFDTPYEGGFFIFSIRFPLEYPSHPPTVKLMTTGGGRVRFNPNWYENGTVCVSILGTWLGPGWTPAQTLSTVLLSIQSLMNAKPYHNEPGFETEKKPGDVEAYNQCIEHETIRVAVCGVLEGGCGNFPEEIMNLSKSLFMEYYDHYVNLCKEKTKLDGKKFKDPFQTNHGEFRYGELVTRLEKLRDQISRERSSHSSASS